MFKNYVGTYWLNMGFLLNVKEDGGHLVADVADQPRFQLFPLSETEFFLTAMDATIMFHHGPSGQADSLSIMVGEQRGTGVRVEVAALTEQQRSHYTGVYYSDELGTFYSVDTDGDELVARHRRHGDVNLTHLGEDDFWGDRWFLQHVRFERDGDQVTGLRVSEARVRNLWFEKQ